MVCAYFVEEPDEILSDECHSIQQELNVEESSVVLSVVCDANGLVVGLEAVFVAQLQVSEEAVFAAQLQVSEEEAELQACLAFRFGPSLLEDELEDQELHAFLEEQFPRSHFE